MSEKIPTMAEYAADCERVAIATLILKQGRFPAKTEVDAELRLMNEPSVDGITRTPVISKGDAAAFLKAHGVGTPNAAWSPPKQSSKATTPPDALPTNPPAASVTKATASPTAAPQATAPKAPNTRPDFFRLGLAHDGMATAAARLKEATTATERGEWAAQWQYWHAVSEGRA